MDANERDQVSGVRFQDALPMQHATSYLPHGDYHLVVRSRGQTYLFAYDFDTRYELLQRLRKFAGDPEHVLTWADCDRLTKELLREWSD